MSRDEDDWRFFVCRSELALKIKTALPGQPHVEDQARGAIRRIEPEKVGNGRKQLNIKPTDLSRRPTEARRSESSSMTKTVGFASGIATHHH